MVKEKPPVTDKIEPLYVNPEFAKAPVAPVTVKTAPAVAVAPRMVTDPPAGPVTPWNPVVPWGPVTPAIP